MHRKSLELTVGLIKSKRMNQEIIDKLIQMRAYELKLTTREIASCLAMTEQKGLPTS